MSYCECHVSWVDEDGKRHHRGRTRFGHYWLEGYILVHSVVAVERLTDIDSHIDLDDPIKTQGEDGRPTWKFYFMYQTPPWHSEGNWMSDLKKLLRKHLIECDFSVEVTRKDFFAEKCPRVQARQD